MTTLWTTPPPIHIKKSTTNGVLVYLQVISEDLIIQREKSQETRSLLSQKNPHEKTDVDDYDDSKSKEITGSTLYILYSFFLFSFVLGPGVSQGCWVPSDEKEVENLMRRPIEYIK